MKTFLVASLLVLLAARARAQEAEGFVLSGTMTSAGANLGLTVYDIARRKTLTRAYSIGEMITAGAGVAIGSAAMAIEWPSGAQQRAGVGSVTNLAFASIATAQVAWSLALFVHGAVALHQAPRVRETSHTLEHASLRSERSSLTPEHSSLTPEHSSLRVERSSLRPEQSSLRPEQSSLPPEHPSLADEQSLLRLTSATARGDVIPRDPPEKSPD